MTDREQIEYCERTLSMINVRLKYPYDSGETRMLLNKKYVVIQQLIYIQVSLIINRHCQ